MPFTQAEFLSVFEQLNRAILPLQLFAYAGAALAVVLVVFRTDRLSDLVAGGVLAAFWAFTGTVYFLGFFRDSSGIAVPAGVLFLLQAGLLAAATARGRLRLVPSAGARSWLAWALVVYAALGYPIVGTLAGHWFPRAPVLGVTPCPTVIFTWGFLLLVEGKPPRALLPIPLLWSLVGASAAVAIGVPEDLGLPIAALLALAALLGPRHAAPTDGTGAPAAARP